VKTREISFTATSMVLIFVFLTARNVRAAEKDGGFIIFPSATNAQGPVVFSHLSHGATGAGYFCTKCHMSPSEEIRKTSTDALHPGRMCGACHNGKTYGPRSRQAAAAIRDCISCHMPAEDIVIRTSRMDPVPFSHRQHLAVDTDRIVSKPGGLSCRDCHPVLFERETKRPIGMEIPHETGGCAQCHNGQKRDDGLPTAFAANARCLTCHTFTEPVSKDTRP
jgi:c(7)-type cytochrome triheme protein